MSVLLYKLMWYAQDEPTIANNITNALSSTSARGLDVKNNVLSFVLKNQPVSLNDSQELLYADLTEGFDQKMREDDTIKLWLHYSDDFAEIEASVWGENNEEPSSDYLQGVYNVVDIDPKQTTSQNIITINAIDKTYVLLNRLYAKNFSKVAKEGTTSGTTTNKLVDSSGDFTNQDSVNVGMTVYNVTDGTSTRLTAVDSSTVLSVADDIFTTGEDYELQWNAPSIVQKVVRFSSETNTSGEYLGTGNDSGVYYDVDARLESAEGGFIQDVRKNTNEDGTSNADLFFPAKGIAKVWKPVYEWLEELSEIEYLNSRDELDNSNGKTIVYGRKFIYYVDENNKFHWLETSNTVDDTIVVGTTPNVTDYNIGQDASDVINFVVYRGGEDFFGNGTLNYVIDTSVNAKTKKMHVIAMTDIATTLIENEIAEGNLVSNTGGTFTYSGNRYNRNGTVTATWNGVAYSSDTDYNTALRAEIDAVGKNRARTFISGRATTRLKGTISKKGFLATPGNLLRVTNKKLGHQQELIRIMAVRHQINKSGWFTTLELEQDDETIIQIG